ncbi:hypothetical protein HK104_011042 [Borealophlyctis nickersoniae]|nr:hypothetical protein HK104_011042 [Borealophlyctis nickersoniae]
MAEKSSSKGSTTSLYTLENTDHESGRSKPDNNDPHRTLGLASTTFLIFNRMIGAGIWATPATILASSGSIGMSLILWVVGTFIAITGMTVYTEYGTALPQSGGEKNYLEFVYRRPKLLITCVYGANAVLLGWAGSNSIVFGEYVLFASGAEEAGQWTSRSIGLACITFCLILHGTSVKWGVRLQNALGLVKIGILVFVVLSGFAALAGHLKVPKPDNFSNAFEGTTDNGYNYASALFKVIWSFIGYSNANYALGEIKRPVRTLKIAGPLAIGIVSTLYILANIAYFAAVPKEQILSSGLTVAGQFFINVFGETAGRRVLPIFIALSALGNVLAVIFSQGRINQELGKEGVLPFSRLWASNRPFNAPLAGLFLHWLVSVVIMLAPPPGDAYNFIIDVITYPLSIVNVFVAVGLLVLRYKRDAFAWSPPFKAPLIAVLFFLASNFVLVVVPFIRPPGGVGDTSLPYYLYTIVAIGILLLGAVYWAAWAVIWPKLGRFKWERVKGELSDGTPIWEYKKIRD